MRASELIRILKICIEQHGDYNVYTKHANGVFGKIKSPKIANRSKSSPRHQAFREDDYGEKVIKI